MRRGCWNFMNQTCRRCSPIVSLPRSFSVLCIQAICSTTGFFWMKTGRNLRDWAKLAKALL